MWGVERLSGTKKAERSKAGNDRVPAKDSTRQRKKKATSGSISRALRSVYDDTLREDIPADFIDLLGKLA
jgi:hypothetical protein